MKLEDLVTTKEMSGELEKAGFEGDTPFYWSKAGRVFVNPMLPNQYVDVPCWTFAQIWEALPSFEQDNLSFDFVLEGKYISLKIADYDETDSSYSGYFPSQYQDIEIVENFNNIDLPDNFPDNAGTIWLWCSEKGYL